MHATWVFWPARCALLLGEAEGALRLVNLRRGEEPGAVRRYPVKGLPRLVAEHPHSGQLGMVVDTPEPRSVLCCIHPSDGVASTCTGSARMLTPALHAALRSMCCRTIRCSI